MILPGLLGLASAVVGFGSWGTAAAVGTGVAAGMGVSKLARDATTAAKSVRELVDASKDLEALKAGTGDKVPEDQAEAIFHEMANEEEAPAEPQDDVSKAEKILKDNPLLAKAFLQSVDAMIGTSEEESAKDAEPAAEADAPKPAPKKAPAKKEPAKAE